MTILVLVFSAGIVHLAEKMTGQDYSKANFSLKIKYDPFLPRYRPEVYHGSAANNPQLIL